MTKVWPNLSTSGPPDIQFLLAEGIFGGHEKGTKGTKMGLQRGQNTPKMVQNGWKSGILGLRRSQIDQIWDFGVRISKMGQILKSLNERQHKGYPKLDPFLEAPDLIGTRPWSIRREYSHIIKMDQFEPLPIRNIRFFRVRAMGLGRKSFALLKKPSGARLIGKPISEYDPFWGPKMGIFRGSDPRAPWRCL